MTTHDAHTRRERDALGELDIPAGSYFGIHTLRAIRNFPFSGYSLRFPFIKAFAQVKQACAATNSSLGYLNDAESNAIIKACREMENGKLHDQIVVDAFQGGAGTSTNMNFNEVIANRAEEILGGNLGEYEKVHPIHHVNMHQSTNDVYPTALKVACLSLLTELESKVSKLQEVLQAKEHEFRDVTKVGRTELTDAVPMTLGMTFGAFADGAARDRWRIFKSRERIKKVNLGGTAIGTGLGAPRDYVLKVTENLRHICGLPVSRAENLVDATQNMDSLVEVSGMLKAYASNLMKLTSDLRLLSSGPATGFGEITLPPLQTGSSIMAGKVNPVMPEAVTQASLQVMGNDQTIAIAAGMGQLELNHLMPLLAHTMLESLTLLINATEGISTHCIPGITANRMRCLNHVERSNTLATVLVPVLGYAKVEELVATAHKSQRTIREEIVHQGIASQEIIDELLSPKRLCKLGFTPNEFDEISN
ncbi:aspartate ammonia-lyase [Pseudodesulfovibrio sp. zrk46]|uniref:aspartate ammonia-lyase n=1 Tax=Pseudodesulfovibrio sp. zrk46 TaxID=2725288 RepID=UPI00144A01A6|nr:aspartate ammonia-lyase [Pseudodesulfovibrio sp. zrk46]QJB57551.1 aspartate ammonia-lyase [Pseudodesulfovibrio sp. zrk46]